MRIYTPNGDLQFSTFTFPDGQPHFKLESHDSEPISVTIELALKTPTDLFMVGLVSDVLRASGYTTVNLDVRYLLAARMDRAIDSNQPFTLHLVSRLINGCGFNRVRVLDVHSVAATGLIRNSFNVLPFEAVKQVRQTLSDPVPIAPDKGAWDRVTTLTDDFVVYCKKTRDPQTGALSGFTVPCKFRRRRLGREVLIIDDICDGGGTFVGLAKVLRAAGAEKVYLYVTHGIFSKGLPLDGIDHVYTTNSYTKAPADWDAAGRGQEVADVATIIPVSMKEM